MSPSAGSLLVASPLLLDPNFYHTVIFLIQHNELGSFGLTLNRAAPFTLGESLTKNCPEPLEDQLLFEGGPVEPQSFLCLHNNFGHFSKSNQLIPGVYFGDEVRVLDAYAFDNPGSELKTRFFYGYSGWGQGQLEHEIKEGSWIVQKAQAFAIFNEDHASLWDNLMSTHSTRYFSTPFQKQNSSQHN